MTCSVMESVVKQALKTFTFSNKDTLKNFNENFSKLVSLVGNISCEDISFEHHLLTQQVQEIKQLRKDRFSNNVKVDVHFIKRAPVTYIQIFENELVTMGVFVIREGNKLPLHNHPLMHGIIRVLAGTLKITSYSVLEPQDQRDKGGGAEMGNAEGKWSPEDGGNLEEAIHRFDIPGLGPIPVPSYKENMDESAESQDSAYQSQDSRQSSHKSPESPVSSTGFCTPDILSYVEDSPRPFLATRHSPLFISSEDGAQYLTPHRRNLHEIRTVDGPAAFLDVIAPPYKPVTLQDCTYFEDLGELGPSNKSVRRLHRIACPSSFYTDEEKYKGPPIQLNTD